MNNRLRNYSLFIVNYSLFIVNYSLFIVLLSGCGEKRPDDMPVIYPCKIKVITKSNEPVTDASVSVMPVSQDNKWAGIGLTDNEGIVNIKTNGKYAGLPAGDYKIVITKYNVTDRGKDKEPLETLIFDKIFASETTTPLELTVKPVKNNEATFTVY